MKPTAGQSIAGCTRHFPGRTATPARIWSSSPVTAGSSFPADSWGPFTPRVLAAMAETPAVCEHVHLPVQSGSSRTLKRMLRRYDRDRYLDVVASLRATVSDISLSTDIIVGFPGETEDEFQETLSLVEQVRFDDAYTFKYSVREGTPAVRIKDHVAEEIKTERIGRLIALVRRIAKQKNVGLIGTTHEVLVEGPAKRGGLLQARTRTNKIALLDGPVEWIGTYRRVRFTGTTGSTFTAWPLEKEYPELVAAWQ